jgi:hypothetical protein
MRPILVDAEKTRFLLMLLFSPIAIHPLEGSDALVITVTGAPSGDAGYSVILSSAFLVFNYRLGRADRLHMGLMRSRISFNVTPWRGPKILVRIWLIRFWVARLRGGNL